MKLFRIATVLALPLLLAACLLTPGKFTSTLDIKRDRSFTFTYVGEAILIDPSESLGDAVKEGAKDSGEEGDEAVDKASFTPVAFVQEGKAEPKADKPETAESIAKRKAIAASLMKEPGYRSVAYLGKGKFSVDYAMSGKLDRAYIFPFNLDAEMAFPWVAIEPRKDGTVRVKAGGFGSQSNDSVPGRSNPFDEAALERRGTFTLTTDAALVMQNNEDGAVPGTGSATKVVWTVTPTSKTVPTAVIRF